MSNAEQPQTTPATIDGIDRAQWIDTAVTMSEVLVSQGTSVMALLTKIVAEGALDEFNARRTERGL